MPRRDSYRDRLSNILHNGDTDKFCRELIVNLRLGEKRKIYKMLEVMRHEQSERSLMHYEEDGATVLHEAVIFNRDPEIISKIVNLCPQLLAYHRPSSTYFKGQTALHIAITKGNLKVVEILLDNFPDDKSKTMILHWMATGSRFRNTVMMGELPLTVAALTFETEMVEMLMNHGSEINRRNGQGNTVLHSLVEFAAIYPDKLGQIVEMMNYFVGVLADISDVTDMQEKDSYHQSQYIWFVKNNMEFTPLQLAAKHGMAELCQYILEIPDLYQILDSHDGLFDIKQYDITEIDPIAMLDLSEPQQESSGKIKPIDLEGVATKAYKSISHKPETRTESSLLEMVFEVNPSSAFGLIDISPVKRVIKAKWKFYKKIYIGWGLIHLLFMSGYTVYAVVKSDMNGGTANSNQSELFSKAYAGIALLFSVIYFLQEVIRMVRKKQMFRIIYQEHKLRKCIYRNGFFRSILFIFALFLFAHSICNISVFDDDNIPLIFALIFGWWFQVFFLRGWLKFSFFTVLIHRVILGDLFRFSVIIAIMLISYTGAMFAVFRGSDVADTIFDSYEGTMMIMFKLFLGLGDMEVFHKAKHPWLATGLFVFFVALTYVLLFNALIAMMANTCNSVSENRYNQWRLQQLAVILFFEDILPLRFAKHVGERRMVKRYDPVDSRVVEENRTFLEVISLKTEYADTEKIKSIQNMKAQALQLNGYTSLLADENDETRTSPYVQTLNQSILPPTRRMSKWQSRRQSKYSRNDRYFGGSRLTKRSTSFNHYLHNSLRTFDVGNAPSSDSLSKGDACVEIS